MYVVPAQGGVPVRLTWHPGADLVQGFTADGKSVLFTSARAVFTTRFTQLFTVPVDGGVEEALPIPNAARATYSPDGRRIAYNPLGPAFLQWKHYRGGRTSRIWLYETRNHAVEHVPQPRDRANDVDPMWVGDTVYFRSDRNGEFNLFGYDTKSKAIRQLTRHDDFPVLSASAGGGRIVYEQAGRLHVLDPGAATTRALTIGVPADLRETRPRFVKGTRYIRNAALSPSGARAVFEFRGEIVTVPGEKGDTRNLTGTPGAHERSPAWSPDGKQIAYFSDASGEYALHVAGQDGKGEPRVLEVAGAGFYRAPIWSPDSQKIAYIDNSQSFYWVDLKSGVSKKVAAQQNYSPLDDLHHSWSPDSKWIAHTVDTQPLSRAIHAYSIEQDKSFPITDGLSEVSEPVFDASGKYPVLFRLDRLGPGARLVRAVERRHAGDAVDLPRRAEERCVVAAREGERRREGREGREGRGGRAGIGDARRGRR